MRSLLTPARVLVFSALATACNAPVDDGQTRIHSNFGGDALTPPTAQRPVDVVTRYLESQGAPAVGLSPTREHTFKGMTHLGFEQVIAGRRVVGAYVKATVDAKGRLVQAIERLARPTRLAPEAVTPRAALEAAYTQLGYPVEPSLAAAEDGFVTTFAGSAVMAEPPTVERVAFFGAAGNLEAGFEVETWTRAGNLLHHTLVDGAGRVVSVELRTQSDSYNVFAEDPLKGPQTVTAGPGAGNAESPAGWLAGSQLNTAINGNNVNAYLDADGNNRPDRGGTAVTTGNFLQAIDLGVAPTTSGNKAGAVQNLFFLTNVIHDTLYRHGFTEAAGNFQDDNFGKGGAGADPVLAEAQDGSGTDNANFATPADGKKPRMQMYLWSAPGPDHLVTVGANIYGAKGAEFGPALTTGGLTAPLAVAGNDLCAASPSSLSGKVAVVDRGNCNFTVKVMYAQSAGAVAVIVVNNDPTPPFTMGGTDRKVKIPSVMVSMSDGSALKSAAGAAAKLQKNPSPAPMLDASLDADIVFHESGHGLTWRMIGGMSGPMAGAIGEGSGDTLALLINGDDRMAEYAAGSPLGIRRYPYAGYPLTYGSVTGTEVHDDGEVFAAILWRTAELFQGAGRTSDDVLGLFVDGMNYTPATPAFQDMRDGMLQAAGTDAAAACLIWQAFAQFGVGVGASSTVTSSTVRVTESFAVPASCQ